MLSFIKVLVKVMLGEGLSFLSFGYLFFLLAAVIVRYLLPKKVQVPALLALSWIFYGTWNPACLIYVLLSTITTYAAGLYIGRPLRSGSAQEKDMSANEHGRTSGGALQGKGRQAPLRRLVLILCLVLNIGLLFFCKYWSMFFSGFEDRLLPVGISFYTLQAVGYVIDCWRYGSNVSASASGADEVPQNISPAGGFRTAAALKGFPPERNFVRYALFVSFFPGILSGPIERGRNMLPQYENPPEFSFDNLKNGMIIMLWGYFLKMVIADRIAIVVDNVYAAPAGYSGVIVLLAVFLYSIQIYCDFAGYSAIAVGSARILGFRMMNNFNAPYLSGSVSEFWRRWHVSLSSWFRDYLYIPLGGSRRGTLRRYLNILIVFGVSGLWHGADVTFVVWGLLHGLYQVVGYVLKPVRDSVLRLMHIDRKAASHRFLSALWTFLLVTFAWIFFRADSMQDAAAIIRNLDVSEPWRLWDGTLLNLGLDMLNWVLLMASLAFLFVREMCVYRGISLRERLLQQGIWLRWIVYIGAVLLVLVCGVWGPDYDAATFIYSMF